MRKEQGFEQVIQAEKSDSKAAYLRGAFPSGWPDRTPRCDPMTRKEAVLNMHQVLIKRRDALRKALAGDLSLLKELRAQASGDVVDAALDSVQDEISSQLAEVESRELARIEVALERMCDGHMRLRRLGSPFPWRASTHCPTRRYALSASENPSERGVVPGRTSIGVGSWIPMARNPTCGSTILNSTSRRDRRKGKAIAGCNNTSPNRK